MIEKKIQGQFERQIAVEVWDMRDRIMATDPQKVLESFRYIFVYGPKPKFGGDRGDLLEEMIVTVEDANRLVEVGAQLRGRLLQATH